MNLNHQIRDPDSDQAQISQTAIGLSMETQLSCADIIAPLHSVIIGSASVCDLTP
jgi:hypothetical protein